MSGILRIKNIWSNSIIYSEKIKKHASEVPLSLAFFALFFIQAVPFMKGYRLTADDIAFHQFAMSGWSASWDFIKRESFGQGRFVHFVDLPFSLLGSYFADNHIFRAFYTGLYFGNFALIGWYVSLLLFGRFLNQVVILIALILISFHPLDYYHLAPTAYPFHVSLPVFLILVSRIKLCILRDSLPSRCSWPESAWLIVFFGGMVFSEYGFIFGVSLVLAEYFARTLRVASGEKRFLRASLKWLRDRYFLKDWFLIALFLAFYIGFRSAYPSGYDGNKVSADFDIGMFAKTLFGHIYGGTSIASFDRYGSIVFNGVNNFQVKDYFLLGMVFFGTYFVSRRCIVGIVSDRSLDFGRTQLIITAAVGVLVALLITIPVALTAKYQSWCTEINACIFLDSRISFLGVGVCIFSMLMYLLVHKSGNSKLINLASLIVAFIAVASYANNKRISIDMDDYSSAWDIGKKIACVNEDQIQHTLSNLVDPSKRISYHPNFDVEYYWIQYLKDQRSRTRCEQPVLISSFFPMVTLGQPMLFKKGSEVLGYLQSGWSSPESWGTWSEGSSAILFFPINPSTINSISIEFNALISSTHPLQRVEIFVNGVSLSPLAVKESSRIVEVKLPEAVKVESFSSVTVEFRLPDAATPKSIGLGDDGRALALGLKAVTFR